ncbi:MAG: NAD-dependent epimerase/dehydratase family protein [Terriglobia bacterium]
MQGLNELKFNKGIGLRILGDLCVVNFSLAFALTLRFAVKIFLEGEAERASAYANGFLSFYSTAAPLLTGLTLLVFAGFGIYTRTRFYAKKYKAVTLFQAITITYLLFIISHYFAFGDNSLISRGVFLASYLPTLLLSGGGRLLKNFAVARYDIVKRENSAASGGPRMVLVVGGAGYIGSVLARLLLEAGYSVRVLDSAIYGNQAVEGLLSHPRFEFVEGDLRHVESLVRAINGCDAVIHLGAIVGDPACDLNERMTREINTFATKLLLQVARGYGVQRLLFASTCAVYGASDFLMDEHSTLNPVSSYAQSKADAEKIVLEAPSPDFCPVVLRLGTVFGHSYRPRFDLVVNLLVARAWMHKKITIYNKDQWRPFVHVHDCARAFVACLDANADVVRGEIFNVGAYHSNSTLGQLGAKVREQLPETEMEVVETNDPRNYRVSFEKIHIRLGFTCERTLEDGIREIKEYLGQQAGQGFAAETFDNSKRLKALGEDWAVPSSDMALMQMLEAPGGPAR